MSFSVHKTNVQMLPTDADYEKLPNFLSESGLHRASHIATEYEYIKILYWLIIAKGHKRILEIGTNVGHSTYWFLKAADKTDGTVTTIDINDLYQGVQSDRLKRFIVSSKKFFNELSPTDQFDFIFVDADHSFIEAYYDILSSEHRIAKGGTIAVHDTKDNISPIHEVDKALLEIMRDTPGKWITYNLGMGLAIGEY